MLSMDRLMSVWLRAWKTTYFKPKHAVIARSILVAFLAILHSPILILFGYREYGANDTHTDYCDSDHTPSIGFMNQWYLVSSFFQDLVPYLFDFYNIFSWNSFIRFCMGLFRTYCWLQQMQCWSYFWRFGNESSTTHHLPAKLECPRSPTSTQRSFL